MGKENLISGTPIDNPSSNRLMGTPGNAGRAELAQRT